MARQVFLTATPLPGERINNFIPRLQSLAEHCDYKEEKNNQVRDRVLTFVADKLLKAKLFREDSLSLAKLIEIVSTYHNEEALILIPEAIVNSVKTPTMKTRFTGKCWKCDKVGHMARECKCSKDHKCAKCGQTGHFEVCCKSTNNSYGREKRSNINIIMAETTQEEEEENEESNIFSAHTDEGPSTLGLVVI